MARAGPDATLPRREAILRGRFRHGLGQANRAGPRELPAGRRNPAIGSAGNVQARILPIAHELGEM